MIEEARSSSLPGGSDGVNPKSGGNSETGREETASGDSRDESLNFFMHRMKLNSQSLSVLSTQQESFGLAWLCAFLKTRETAATLEGKKMDTTKKKLIPFEFPRKVDLSDSVSPPPGWGETDGRGNGRKAAGVHSVSPEKIYALLKVLPSTVEEIKLDSRAVRGRALPLLLKFLEERLQAVREGRNESLPRLKSFTFAENAMEAEEASQVLPLLLPYLEHFCLKGNVLGVKGFSVLAECIREGKADSLRSLDLSDTRLNMDGMENLCSAIKERGGMRVETLDFSENQLAGEKTKKLCSVLDAGSLKSLRMLLLKGSLASQYAVRPIADSMRKGSLPNLEVLDLTRSPWSGGWRGDVLQLFEGALHVGLVPRLRELNLGVLGKGGDREVVRGFLSSLNATECPPSLQVSMEVGPCSMDAPELCELGAGKKVEWINEVLELFAQALRKGHFSSVEEVWLESGNTSWEELQSENPDGGVLSGGVSAFFRAVSDVKLGSLAYLSSHVPLTNDHVVMLAEGVRKGNLCALASLDMSGCRGMGKEGTEALMGAVTDSESGDGMPPLEVLYLPETNAGEGGLAIGTALLSEKLRRLRCLDLRDSGLTDEGLRGLADAVRGGAMEMVRHIDLSENAEVEKEVWGDFMKAIIESEKGLPHLQSLKIIETAAKSAGGPVVSVLGSGKLPSLERLFPGRRSTSTAFSLNREGVAALADTVRVGGFPPSLQPIAFCLSENPPRIDVDPVFFAIAESEKGLPSCIERLDFKGGRLGEGAVAFLAARGGGTSGGRLVGLEQLNLAQCEIDDNTVRRLGELFRAHECGTMKEDLYLHSNCISVEGVSAFFDALSDQSLPNLQKLSVGGQRGIEGGENEKDFSVSVMALGHGRIQGSDRGGGKLPRCLVDFVLREVEKEEGGGTADDGDV
uniref:Uncharacterized protein n=1 Tax=Chromera velia CCMP2878 TaxID=1169474 RepID=A0A0G4I7Y8_9ALVE|eukprot:Cvel_11806.t1-p1 / transcript=Cvel_11806.t1 / gene=Cvel_11806 / organism=Chromera_velia_CCMP2878 / gene_product=hypothetical protein / transcript_product=hypothetical protein / location=Cvel_scaffold751:31956-37236(+) / protein_length=913 / sequence_SO=supercontig / SO=protein_coding / is_pseudo=false